METRNKVYLNREFNCPVGELFNWLVHPELIAQWFGPKHLTVGEVITEVQTGGRYSIELKKSGDDSFFIEGRFLNIEKPNQIVISMEYTGVSSSPPKSTVHFSLEALGPERTKLSMIQEFEFIPANMADRTKAWEHMFSVLSNLLYA